MRRRRHSLGFRQAAFNKYGAQFVVCGGAFQIMEGTAGERNVVVEFNDYAAALACYRSPKYQAVRELRQKCAVADFIVIEGAASSQIGASFVLSRIADIATN